MSAQSSTLALATVVVAQEHLRDAVLDAVRAEHGGLDQAQAAQDRVALAARDLVEATDALPVEHQPEGWSEQ